MESHINLDVKKKKEEGNQFESVWENGRGGNKIERKKMRRKEIKEHG